MVMVKMVKIENGKKEKYSIIYKYIYLYIIVQKWPFRKSILTKMTMTTLTTTTGCIVNRDTCEKIEKDRKKFVDRNEILLPLPRREMSV